MNPIALAGPAVEPVTLADMKAYLRLDSDGEDELVEALIMAGRLAVERATRIQLVEQSWRFRLRAWPVERAVALPFHPLISVEAVRVFPASGLAEVIGPDLYRIDGASEPARLLVESSVPDPGRRADGIEIDVTSGFGATPAAIPGPLILAVQRLVAHWFENRGDDARRAGPGLPPDALALVAPFARRRLA